MVKAMGRTHVRFFFPPTYPLTDFNLNIFTVHFIYIDSVY